MVETILEPFPDSKILGVMRGITGIRDAVAIVHGKSCCHADTLLFHVLNGSHDYVRVLGSGMRSQDVSVGGFRKLSLSIRSAYKEFKPELIAVLVASFPTLMGDDVDGALERLKEDIPCRLCSFSCAGYEGNANRGYEEVLSRLVQYMEAFQPVNDSINIIGFKSDDPHAVAEMEEIKRMLVNQGVTVNAVITSCTFDEVRRAPSASLNVIMSGEGLNCARLMNERFGIPYITVPYPFGWNLSTEFLRKITEALGKKLDQDVLSWEKERLTENLRRVYTYLQGIYGLPVAVVGDGERSIYLALFLSDELGMDVRQLCLTSERKSLSNTEMKDRDQTSLEEKFEEILVSRDEFHMEEAIKSKNVHAIFGSTMQKCICRELGIPLIRTSYPILDAVSVADIPYMGFKGIANVTQTIINAIIGQG